MGATQIRAELRQFIDMADDRFIAAIYAMMQQYLKTDDSIVAYTVDGRPLNKQQYVEEVLKAERDVEGGRILTSGQLLEEIEKWGREDEGI